MRYLSNDRMFNLSLKEHNNAPWSDEKKLKYYASGREAIVSLIDAFVQRGLNRVALLPAYVPQGLYAPFEKRGWKIILYPINKELSPIFSEVELLIEKYSPSIAIMIHYFGTLQPIDRFKKLCHKKGIKVIEDYAHILPSRTEIDYKGDYILYSLPKMVGIVDGAVLVIRDKDMDINRLKYHKKKSNHTYIIKQSSLLFFNTLLSKIPHAKIVNILSAILGKSLNSYSNLMRIYHNPNEISRLSRKIIKQVDFDEVVRIRNGYAQMYEKQLDPSAFIKLLSTKEKKRATFGYPVLINNRESLYRYLVKKGIYGTYLISNWNYIPKNSHEKERFISTEYIINHHFIFPTPLHLKEKDIQKIIDCANEWANSL